MTKQTEPDRSPEPGVGADARVRAKPHLRLSRGFWICSISPSDFNTFMAKDFRSAYDGWFLSLQLGARP